MPDNEHIDISFDGEPEQRASSTDRDCLIITNDDLLTIPDEPAPVIYPGLPPGVSPTMPGVAFPGKQKGNIAHILDMPLWQMALAGAIGGLLAWIIIEPNFNEHIDETERTLRTLLIHMGLFGALMGGGIGLALGAVEGIVGRVYQKALIGGALGLGIGFVGGFFGGVVGQLMYVSLGPMLFDALGKNGVAGVVAQVVARTIGWAAIGACVGLGQGVAIRSTRKILQGLVGGLIGGGIGGLLFDLIAFIFQGGAASRMLAIIITGACTGAAIGMVEELAKQAWLRITQGPMAGKEFILYHVNTSIGSSPKCEITIPKDPFILPQHCVIQSTGHGYALSSFDQRSPAFVNGRPAPQAALRDGDSIQLGQTVLLYSERAAKNTGEPSYPAPPGGYGGI